MLQYIGKGIKVDYICIPVNEGKGRFRGGSPSGGLEWTVAWCLLPNHNHRDKD